MVVTANNEDTVYEVDSTTGAVTDSKGDVEDYWFPNTQWSCTTPFTNSATNNKLTITNGSTIPITTFEVDTCTGDTRLVMFMVLFSSLQKHSVHHLQHILLMLMSVLFIDSILRVCTEHRSNHNTCSSNCCCYI